MLNLRANLLITGVHVAGLLSQTILPLDLPPPLRTRGIFDPWNWGGHRGLVVGVFNCGPTSKPTDPQKDNGRISRYAYR